MEEAERLYQEALESFRSGNIQRAITVLERSLAVKPEFPDALEALGVCYSKENRLDEAIDVMKRLIKMAPNHIMAHANLSRFYVQKGMILEAEQEQAEARRLSWKEELKAQKSVHSDPLQTAEQISKENEREIESRIDRYQKVIQLDPQDVLGYFSLGTACLDAKRLEEARSAFEKAVRVDPNHSPSYFSLGLALESLKQVPEAIKVYENGIKVADSRGDMIPLRKMEARLRMLQK